MRKSGLYKGSILLVRMFQGWRATIFIPLFLLVLISPEVSQAQHREPVNYYRSPYWYGVQIDPIGQILGRASARFEWRVDPLLSRYFEFAYQKNVSSLSVTAKEQSMSLGIGERIYLRDNAAIVGFFAGANLGFALINSKSFGARISLEIGCKIPFTAKSHFFVEPELMIDAYFIHPIFTRQIFPYFSLPFGYLF
jgi:hypothetical protein